MITSTDTLASGHREELLQIEPVLKLSQVLVHFPPLLQ